MIYRITDHSNFNDNQRRGLLFSTIIYESFVTHYLSHDLETFDSRKCMERLSIILHVFLALFLWVNEFYTTI